MTKFFEKQGKRFVQEVGKSLCPTKKKPQVGDQITRGRHIYQVRADGSRVKVQSCGGSNHLLRANTTQEGGR